MGPDDVTLGRERRYAWPRGVPEVGQHVVSVRDFARIAASAYEDVRSPHIAMQDACAVKAREGARDTRRQGTEIEVQERFPSELREVALVARQEESSGRVGWPLTS